MSNNRNAAESVAETYYDSSDADTFYETVWGGEDIHIGLYSSPATPIAEASRRTVTTMADQLPEVSRAARMLDLGAGYGGSARYLAERFGCQLTCVNLSERQNQRNRMLNRKQGLSGQIDVVHGSFEELSPELNGFDVIWSQDAFLHSGNRDQVLDEIARVLSAGGDLIFTDPMQADDCRPDVLQPVYDRLQLDTLGSLAYYHEGLCRRGFDLVQWRPMVEQLRTHYARVKQELESRFDELQTNISSEYITRMINGLGHWVAAADKGYLNWGILHFRKK
ncbi:MAG: hypothetical protein Tsb002_26580 [Wenzhouxiangellaceae bacterium]